MTDVFINRLAPRPDCVTCGGEGVDADPYGRFDYECAKPCPQCYVAAATNQPQTDALKEENERLREHLISALDTLKDAEVCDDQCEPCNQAYAALKESK